MRTVKAPASLLLPLALTLASTAGCLDEDLINPMSARQPKVGNYSESDFYSDGLAMREPPQGTVPRERVVANAVLSAGRTQGPRGDEYTTTFPLKVDAPLLALGKKRFDIICATCHGPIGDGDSIVARQMALRPPPSLHLYADRPPGYIFDVVTRGFGMMASYAAELPVHERWAVVAYVRALQISQTTPADSVSPEVRAQLNQPAAADDQPGAPAEPARQNHPEAP